MSTQKILESDHYKLLNKKSDLVSKCCHGSIYYLTIKLMIN